MKEIILFGGAFDPPHLGHHTILLELLDTYSEALVIVTPTGKRIDKFYHTSDVQRKAMIELWIDVLHRRIPTSI